MHEELKANAQRVIDGHYADGYQAMVRDLLQALTKAESTAAAALSTCHELEEDRKDCILR